ncbi:MAG: alpha/beta family hydrolase [Thiohalocapsa sp.]
MFRSCTLPDSLSSQGERDPFGRREEVQSYALSPACEVAWIDDGEHSYKPHERSGRIWEDNLRLVVERVSAFVATL